MRKTVMTMMTVFLLLAASTFAAEAPQVAANRDQSGRRALPVPEMSCGTDTAMRSLYDRNPESAWEAEAFNQMTASLIAQGFSEDLVANAETTYVIPVVFHVFGTAYDGITVNDALIIDALNKTNQDFQGLTADWSQVSSRFSTIKRPLSITFKLAKKDPNGQPTTGIKYYGTLAGFGNDFGYDSQIQQYAWDNYKYFNVYIMRDLYNDGDYFNSGVCWYPDTWMSDNNLARAVYNGRYLGTNTTENFRRVLTHEFGHYLNLIHTFEGGCSSTNDQVTDTPATTVNSGTCNLSIVRCSAVPNGENFMDYTECYRMYTAGQVSRMQAALQHAARFPLWQPANLVATGVSTSTCSYSISPTSASYGTSSGSGSVSVTAGTGCAWTATSSASWITVTAGSSGSGNGTVSYSVASNTATSSRTGTMTIAGQTFSVTQAGSGGTTATALSNGVGVSASGASGNQKLYYIDVPSGASNLVMALSGGTGDADMYTRFGSAPTLTTYDCRPYANGNNETCSVAAPSAGRYYIMLHAYTAYSGATLRASYTTGTTGTLRVISPNGGEVWTRGTTRTISWDKGGAARVDVALYRGTTFIQWITWNNANSSFSWTIPTSLSASSTYKIRLIDYDVRSRTDYSDSSFTIN